MQGRFVLGVLVAAVVSGLVAGVEASSTAGTTVAPNRAVIAKCFRDRNVLVDTSGAWYLPKRVEVRERQMALSFALLRTGAGLQAIVVFEPSLRAAMRVRARAIAHAVETGGGNAKLYARYAELHGTRLVGWLGGLPGFEPRRIVTKCLGPRTG